MLPIYIALSCAMICLILYFLDRRFRGESIDMLTAGKLFIIGGLMGGGITYTISPSAAPEVAKAATELTQEIFDGQPTF